MAMTPAQYREQLRALLPPGKALDDGGEGTLTELLDALAAEWARVDASADSLLDEADPSTTYYLLPDWERVAGLPDPCFGDTGGTLDQRRKALVQRLTSRGGQSPAYFIALAQSLGYAITITEFKPFRVSSDVSQALQGPDWAYAWRVNAPKTTVTEMTVESGVDEALRTWGNTALECVIEARSPAHTYVLFAYA